MRIWFLGGQFFCEIWENYVALAYSSFFGCFQCNSICFCEEITSFHNIPLFRVSWGEMLSWAVFRKRKSYARLVLSDQSFTEIQLSMRIWCLRANSYVKFEKTIFPCIFILFWLSPMQEMCFSEAITYFHMIPLFSVSWEEILFWAVFVKDGQFRLL